MQFFDIHLKKKYMNIYIRNTLMNWCAAYSVLQTGHLFSLNKSQNVSKQENLLWTAAHTESHMSTRNNDPLCGILHTRDTVFPWKVKPIRCMNFTCCILDRRSNFIFQLAIVSESINIP